VVGRTPDARDGPLWEESVIWEEQASDPAPAPDGYHGSQYVTGKGLVILEDGVVRGIGESRVNVWQYPVDDRDVNAPPGSPATGYRVIVGGSPTGAFVGHAGEIAQWTGAAWVFTTPRPGTTTFVKDEALSYQQTATSAPWTWYALATGGGITEAQHKGLDQLVHELAESCYYEVTYGSGSRVDAETWWTTAAKLIKVRETTYTYSSGKAATETIRQYDGTGTLVATLVITYTYSGSKVASATYAYSEP